ncbi:MAG: M23 family metallopeptidase, partial [Acetobacteraceae bacterium]
LLGPEFLRQVALWYLDELLTRLNALPLDADLAKARRLRLARALLTRLRAQLVTLPLPSLDMEALARALDTLLHRTGFAQALREITCALDGIAAALDGAMAVGQTIRPTPQPVGAGVVPLADSIDYSYYGSWLLNGEDIPLLSIADLKFPQAFIQQIRTGVGRMGTYLRDRFSPEERQVLDSFTSATDDVPRDVLLTVLAVVNREMQRTPLLGSGDNLNLAPNEMTDEIREFQENWESDQSLFLFNRRVLEAAFPTVLDTLTGGFWRGLERIALPIIAYPRNQVFVTGDRKFVMCDDKPLHVGTNVNWYDAPMFSGSAHGAMWFKFDHASPRACEILAWILSMAAETGKSIWHLVGIQPNHEVQTGLVAGIEIADTIQQLLFGRPVSAYFLECGAHGRRWGKSLDSLVGLKGIATFASSFQGMHTDAPAGNGFSFWATVISGDLFRVSGPIQMLNAIRDIVLGIVTLINFRGPQDGPSTLPSNPARNHTVQGPFVSLSDSLMAMALISLSPRDNYSILLWSKDGAGDKRLESLLGHWLGGSVGFGVLSGLAGSFVAQVFAWAEDWERLFTTAGISAGKMFGLYWVFNYLFKENSTDDGKYKPGGGNFRGYPDKSKADSPYRLPYPGGVGRYVSQGNLGLWSHNYISNTDFETPSDSATQQTYAYDFGHDFREPIACVRAGTVVSFDDSNADSNESTPNKIVIKHATIDDEHDNFGSGPVQTYSVYLHLAKDGVTTAPHFSGGGPIVGASVAQGDLIARAGDTGMSFHNHLHLHIVPDDGGGNPSGDFAIPFVFQDVDGDGVPKSLTWYKSGNT